MLPHLFLFCLACNEAVLSKKADTGRAGLGDRLSDTGVRPTAPCVRLKLCCDSACLHCAPLCTTINTALCCHTVVILRLMRNITIMLLKLFH